jgi:cytochrome b561
MWATDPLQGFVTSMTTMTTSQANARYDSLAKLLHWAILGLLAMQFVIAWTMPHIKRDTQPDTLINLHFSFGVVILAVVVVRLGWRLTHAAPPPEQGLPSWQVLSAQVMHWLLYLLLVVSPILGWINASWRGFPVTLFGLLEMPKLIATRAPGFRWTGDTHVIMSNYILLILVGLHVAAVLYHYFVRRDGVLQRMLPGS